MRHLIGRGLLDTWNNGQWMQSHSQQLFHRDLRNAFVNSAWNISGDWP